MNVHRLNLESTPAVELNPLGAEGQPLPVRVKLLNWGDNQTLKGLFRVGKKTLTALSAMQKKLGFDRVALDFEHNTLPGTTAFKEAKEPRPVAAFGVPEVVEGEGLFLTGLNWTPEGEKNARNFLDLSAVPSKDETDEVVFVHSAALCRQGATPGMHLFSLSVELTETGSTPTNTPPTGVSSDTPQPTSAAQVLSLEALSAENTALKTSLAELSAVVDGLKANIGSLVASATPAPELTALSTGFADLRTQLSGAATMTGLTALTAEVSALRSSLSAFADKHERELLLLTARTQGKLIPLSAEGLATASLATLRDLVASAKPGQVPMHRLTPLNVAEGNLSASNTDLLNHVSRMCGVDPATAAKQPRPGRDRQPLS